jgi:uncharacterized protein (TIGR00255 family)
MELANAYLDALNRIAEATGIKNDLSVSELVHAVRDIIVVREEREEADTVFERILPHLESLLDDAVRMSLDEGERLARDISGRIGRIEEFLDKISRQASHNLAESLKALEERINRYLSSCPVDEGRMAQETAILIDRLDITEELVRAESHVKQFRIILETDDRPIGRKLDFLLQELFREVNTMASKSSSDLISQWVVEIKTELEKIREQVQNIV